MTVEPSATHLDLDELADALAGSTDQAGHLSGCASCTSRLAELQAADARVVASLRALPAPAVPGDLAARLTAAFAAEPPLGSAAAPAATGNVTALPDRAARRRFLPAAAAAVLVLAGGGLGYGLVTGTGTGSSDDTASLAAGDSGAEAAALATSASGTDYADAAAVGAVLPAVLAGGATGAAADTALAMAAPPAAAGGTASAPSEQARASAAQPAAEDPLARLRTPGGLEDCLTAVLPPEEPDLRPSALDYATYQGQPALAIVLPDPDPAKLSVFVVGADCAAADAKVLSFLRVDAP